MSPLPGDESYPLTELTGSTDRLAERGVVLLTGALDVAAATRAAAQLMLLDASHDGPVELHLTCPDGDLDAASMLAETIALMRVPVRALCRGVLGGPALDPYAAASRRLASPHATFVLREPVASAHGRADDVAAMADVQGRQLAAWHARLAAATGRATVEVAQDLRTGRVLTAQEALAYGLVHELTGPAHP